MNQNTASLTYDSNIVHSYRYLRRNFWKICIGTGIFSALAILYIIVTQPLYSATVKVVPKQAGRENGLSGGLGQFSGLASAVGIPLGAASSGDNFEILRAKNTVVSFIRANKLESLFLEERWNAEKNVWKPRGQSITSTLRFWDDSTGYGDLSSAPLDSEIYEASEETFAVKRDDVTQVTSIKVTWEDPTRVAQWANGFISFANEKIRQKALNDAEENLEYLYSQIGKVQTSEVRNSVSKLIEEQLKQVMLANQDKEFAFRIVDPAVMPHVKAHPRSLLILIIAVIFGGTFSVLLLLIRKTLVEAHT